MLAALQSAKAYPWKVTAISTRWETWLEMVKLKGVECDGHMFGALQEFARLCREQVPPPWPDAFFIIGKLWATTNEDRHAWIGFRGAGENEEWGDPTPGYPGGLLSMGSWSRVPEWGYPLNIESGVPALPGFPYCKA